MFSLHEMNEPKRFERIKKEMIQELCCVQGVIWSPCEMLDQIIFSLKENKKIYVCRMPKPKLEGPADARVSTRPAALTAANRVENLKIQIELYSHLCNQQKDFGDLRT